MEEKKPIRIEELKQYFDQQGIDEKKLFNGRPSQKAKGQLDAIFSNFTYACLRENVTRVEFTWHDRRPFQTNMPEPFEYSKFRSAEDLLEFINGFNEACSRALRKADMSFEVLRGQGREEQERYAVLQKSSESEVNRLNSIRRVRELNLADLNRDTLKVFYDYNKAVEELGRRAQDRLDQKDKDKNNGIDLER